MNPDALKADAVKTSSKKSKPGQAMTSCPDTNTFRKECQNCMKHADDAIAEADVFADAYRRAGNDPKNKTGTDIENAVEAMFAAQGATLEVAGTTDSSGTITVKKQKGPCARLEEEGTLAHEESHAKHVKELEKKHGKGTAAFKKAFSDAKDWADDEVVSREVDKKFWRDFKNDCKSKGYA